MTIRMKDPQGNVADVEEEEVDARLAAGWTPLQEVNRVVLRRNPATGEMEAISVLASPDAIRGFQDSPDQRMVSPTTAIGGVTAFDLAREQTAARNREAQIREIGAGGVFGRQLASTLTFGLTEALYRGGMEDPEAYGEFYGEALQEYDTAAMAGTLGGFLVPGLGAASWGRYLGAGGAGLAARAAVGRAVTARGGTGFQRLLAEAAADGGVSGALAALQAANEVGDYENLSARMLAGGGMGALIGTAAEGALGAVVGRLSRGSVDEAESAALAQTIRSSNEPGALTRAVRRAQDVVSGVDVSAIRSATGRRLDDEVVLSNAAYMRRNRNQVVKEMTEDILSEIERGKAALSELLSGGAVSERLKTLARGVDFAPAATSVRMAAQEIARSGIRTTPSISRVLRRAKAAKGSWTSLDAVRRDILDVRRRLGPEAVEEVQVIDNLVASIDRSIADVGGDFATTYAQRAAAVEGITGRLQRLSRTFRGESGEEMTSSTVQAAIRAASEGKADRLGDVFTDMAANGIAPEARGLVDDSLFSTRYRGREGIATQQFRERLDQLADSSAFEAAAGLENKGSGLGATLGIGGGAGLFAGVAGGFAVGGLPGALIGGGTALGAAMLSRPVGFMRGMHALRNVFRSQDQRLAAGLKGVDDLVSGTAKPTGFSELPLRPQSLAYVWIKGNDEEKRSKFEEIRNNVLSMSDPETLLRSLEREMQGSQHLNEHLASEYAMGASRALSALTRRLPQSRGAALGQFDIPRVQLDDFLEAATVIEDPIFAVDLMSRGVLTQNAARAVEEAHPQLYAYISADVLARYARQVERERRRPSYQVTSMLSAWFNAPLDASLETPFIREIQSPYAQTQAQQRSQFSQPGSYTRREIGRELHRSYETMGSRLQS